MSVERYKEARLIADSGPGMPVIEACLSKWWIEFCDQDTIDPKRPYDIPELPNFEQYFQECHVSVSGDLLNGFAQFSDDPHRNEDEGINFDVASILIARAVANGLLDTSNAWTKISLAMILCEYNEAFEEQFDRYICEKLSPSNPERSKWIESLRRGEWSADRAVYSSNRQQVESLKAIWEREQNPFSVWDEYCGFLGISPDSFYPLVLLFKASCKEWVSEFERLPMPVVKGAFIDCYSTEFDQTRIFELIDKAPPIFSEGSWNRNTALLYVPLIVLQRMAEADVADEFKASLHEIFERLLARPDGVEVVSRFQEWLLKEYRNSLGKGREGSLGEVLECLTKVISDKNENRSEGDWFVLLGEVLAEHERNPNLVKSSNIDIQWTWLKLLLLEKDDALLSCLANYATAEQISYFAVWAGYLLSCSADINEEWEKAWHELDRQRELAWHWNYEGDDPILGSLALIEIASGAISWKLEQEDKDVLFKFWEKLLTYVYSLWVKRSDYFAETCQRTLVRCVVWGVTLFKDLKKCIPIVIDTIGNDSELYSHIVLNLHANGIDGKNIVAEFQAYGLDLSRLMTETIEWSDLSQKKGQVKLANKCKKFLHEFGDEKAIF